ncbi:PucR family transcriptional regulator [Paenarthrobacter sp. PH39-S1]|uniref:helix-turn-helix domain-containing protein n=1 Tax=Paenarthrobacter sp. PH39-S1 TaxID=3046204 RepID=UPI0024B96A99|nr:PucR family transcriptional regulator [Paenarthrobacter sp. PH39-S1]MDJ0355677.1 PucR family transcriptional regulator ligand-binding domain-containing protein [Paenarthrobacter sp. PH39-S1]
MLPTVRQVLDLPVLRRAVPEVLGGAAGLDRPVRWVHVSEVRDLSGLLTGGELLLTTGLELGPSAAQTLTYLKALESTGASGLIVELTGPRAGTEAALRAAAAGVSMPVITVAAARFVEITEIVHRLIVAEQLELVELSRSVHEAFTLLSLESAGTEEIVSRAARFVQAPVILEDLSHLVLAHAAAGHSTTELLADWERRSRVTQAGQLTVRTGPEGWLQTPVGLRRQVWGRLIIPVPLESDAVAAMVLERAGQALSINRLAERDQRQLSQQAQAGLLNELRQPRTLTETEAVTRAAALGLHPSPLYLPVVVRVGGAGGAGSSPDPLAGQRHERLLLDRLARVLKSAGSSALTASLQAGYLGMILALPAKQLEQQLLERICNGLADRNGRNGPETDPDAGADGWTMGVSHARAGLLEAAAGLDDASHVARTASTLKERSRPFFRSADVRLRGLLALLRNDFRVQAFAESELAGVLRHDAHDDDDYLTLLQSYLEHGGNKAAMARDGFLSRPTLYARLARLEEILGLNLDNPESRTSLHVALLLHQLRGL